MAKIIHILAYSNFLSRIASNKVVGYVAPTILGFYYLTLDVWGDDWAIVANYRDVHEWIYIWLVTISIVGVALRGIRELYAAKINKSTANVKDAFIILTSRVVKAKLVRFKECAATISGRTTNTFKKITQPDTQIQIIISELIHFLHYSFNVLDDSVCITVMHQNVDTNGWYYLNDSHKGSWKHTKAAQLMSEKSMAVACLKNGEPIFYPDKMAAAKKSLYFVSDKDLRGERGSAFCYPVVLKVGNKDYKFVISVITYGKVLCDSHHTEDVEAVRLTLSEICRRIEIELTLWSIKSFQENFTASPPVRAVNQR